jgi:hypothetical protein
MSLTGLSFEQANFEFNFFPSPRSRPVTDANAYERCWFVFHQASAKPARFTHYKKTPSPVIVTSLNCDRDVMPRGPSRARSNKEYLLHTGKSHRRRC